MTTNDAYKNFTSFLNNSTGDSHLVLVKMNDYLTKISINESKCDHASMCFYYNLFCSAYYDFLAIRRVSKYPSIETIIEDLQTRINHIGEIQDKILANYGID